MAHQGLNDLDFQLALRDALVTLCPSLEFHAARQPAESLFMSDSGDRHTNIENTEHGTKSDTTITLKIGFVSTYFIDHSIGRITAELLIYLNQQRVLRNGQQFALEVYAYTVDRHIPSDTPVVVEGTAAYISDIEGLQLHEDIITRALQQHLGARSVRLPDNITTVREVTAAAQLDMLVFTDVGMEFATYALAYSRLAPVQVCVRLPCSICLHEVILSLFGVSGGVVGPPNHHGPA
jgi:predicted O-linked N-acetylglucosamine transferase (SPINDLY family)